MSATPNRDGLRKLYPHTTLIQSFDTARFHDDRFEEAERVNLARTEVFMNLLYGREIVIPAGQIAESPAMATLFLEIMGAYEKHTHNIPERARWQPFRIALDDKFRDYKDYVGKYEDIGAPMAILPLGERRKVEERQKALAHVKQLFLDGKYKTLAKTVQRDGFDEYARLVTDYFNNQSAIRPIRKGILDGSANFSATIRNRLKNIPEGKRDIDSIPEIDDTISFFDGLGENCNFRGVWYANRERFGDSWELARVWLDQALYYTLAEQYGIEHPVYLTQDLRRHHYDPQVILGYNTPTEGDLKRPELPNQTASLPNLNWDVVWDVLTDRGFHHRAEDLTAKINNAQWDNELDTAIWKHTEYLNEVFTDLSFDLRKGVFILDVKKKPGRLTGILTGALAAGAVPLLLNSFLPASGSAAAFFQSSSGILAAGAAGLTDHVITSESQWFYRRRKNKLKNRNKGVLRDAMEVVNFWTKPVLNAGAIARARSSQNSKNSS